MSNQRSAVLELAVLGILHETPMHGYELRKRLNSLLGALRAFGYGSLYPALKDLLGKGLIAQDAVPEPGSGRPRPTAAIEDRLPADRRRQGAAERPARATSARRPWEDDGFGVHFAFFGLTQAEIRLARTPRGPPQQARRAARGLPRGSYQDPRAGRQLHAGAAAARTGVGGA